MLDTELSCTLDPFPSLNVHGFSLPDEQKAGIEEKRAVNLMTFCSFPYQNLIQADTFCIPCHIK